MNKYYFVCPEGAYIYEGQYFQINSVIEKNTSHDKVIITFAAA